MDVKRQLYLNDPWHTAIHEAGDAVIGRDHSVAMDALSVSLRTQ
jgi:hypothetical protein